MAVNKVVYGTTVLVDLTSDTVTADTLKKGSTAHNSAGELITGTMPTATQAIPSISVNSSGLITASSTQSAGYVEAGTKSATKQLTVQAAKTITPSTSSQTAVASGVYTTGAITVAAIPSSYVKPTATKGATTYTPTTSNQTIASGTYLSGTQTIKGDANLVAGNIKSGVSIFGVNGTYEGSGGSGGGSAGTCNVTINAPGYVTVIGWGESTITLTANGVTLPNSSLPSTESSVHNLPMDRTYNFPNVPVGSTFVFYTKDKKYIKGATVSDNIEFSFVNHDFVGVTDYNFAICRCNGDGEITINV